MSNVITLPAEEDLNRFAQDFTTKLIEMIKDSFIDQNFVVDILPGMQFKVYIQDEQINLGLIDATLRNWLNGFFKSSDADKGESLNGFEKEFFDTVFTYAGDKEIFTAVKEIDTHMWIVEKDDEMTPNAVFFAYSVTPTDTANPDYVELEKQLKAGVGILMLAHSWLRQRHFANTQHSMPILQS